MDRIAVNVYYRDGATLWLLKKYKQLSKDGELDMQKRYNTLSGEMRAGEQDPPEAVYRMLFESFGIEKRLPLILCQSSGIYIFDVFLSKDLYHPSGHEERHPGYNVYFKWKKAQKNKAQR